MSRITFLFLWLMLMCSSTWALPVPIQIIPTYNMANFDNDINKLYMLPGSHANSITTRMDFDSQYFLNKPYKLFPSGEGAEALFDQNPLYRTDVFDCLTYVNTVIALAHSNTLAEFKHNMRLISYKDGNVAFIQRNHFTDADWNLNNAKARFIKDITLRIHNKKGKPVAQYARTWIDKPHWYRYISPTRIQLFRYPGDVMAKQLLQAMQAQANQVKAEKVILPYVPLNILFDKKGQPDLTLFSQIPNGAVIEIIRPNWDLREQIGTRLNVSHLGFVFQTSQGVMFREASSEIGQVTQILFVEYLKHYLHDKTVKGINIQQVL